jgi:hypothetical protein
MRWRIDLARNTKTFRGLIAELAQAIFLARAGQISAVGGVTV